MAIDVLADASPSSRVRDRRATWLFCIIAALAVLICAFRGLGMDVDSTAYLASGANLAHGHGLTGIGGTPFTLFGPALPSFVAVGVLVGLSAQTAALIVNVLSAVLTVIVGRILLKRHVSDPRLIVAGSVFIAIGWPLIQVTSLAIPEPITVVVLLLLVLVLEEFNQTRRPVVSLAAMVGLLNLAFFLRYANLAFIPVAVLVVFFARRTLTIYCADLHRLQLSWCCRFLDPAFGCSVTTESMEACWVLATSPSLALPRLGINTCSPSRSSSSQGRTCSRISSSSSSW